MMKFDIPDKHSSGLFHVTNQSYNYLFGCETSKLKSNILNDIQRKLLLTFFFDENLSNT